MELRREALYDQAILDVPMPVYIKGDTMFISFLAWNLRDDLEPQPQKEECFREYSITEGIAFLQDEHARKNRYFVYAMRSFGDPAHEEIP